MGASPGNLFPNKEASLKGEAAKQQQPEAGGTNVRQRQPPDRLWAKGRGMDGAAGSAFGTGTADL